MAILAHTNRQHQPDTATTIELGREVHGLGVSGLDFAAVAAKLDVPPGVAYKALVAFADQQADLYGGPQRDAIFEETGVNGGSHHRWCVPEKCGADLDSDGLPLIYHKGVTLTTNGVAGQSASVYLEHQPVKPGRMPSGPDDGTPHVVVSALDAELTPQGARALAANLLYLASLADAVPARQALVEAVGRVRR